MCKNAQHIIVCIYVGMYARMYARMYVCTYVCTYVCIIQVYSQPLYKIWDTRRVPYEIDDQLGMFFYFPGMYCVNSPAKIYKGSQILTYVVIRYFILLVFQINYNLLWTHPQIY